MIPRMKLVLAARQLLRRSSRLTSLPQILTVYSGCLTWQLDCMQFSCTCNDRLCGYRGNRSGSARVIVSSWRESLLPDTNTYRPSLYVCINAVDVNSVHSLTITAATTTTKITILGCHWSIYHHESHRFRITDINISLTVITSSNSNSEIFNLNIRVYFLIVRVD